MRKMGPLAGIAMAVFVTSFSAGALAHPGAKLLTTSSKSAPAAMSPGVRFEEVNGVHVFRGRASDEAALLGGGAASASGEGLRDIIVIHDRPCRTPRRLRTQGFYSGGGYLSRRYTQGFYSGR